MIKEAAFSHFNHFNVNAANIVKIWQARDHWNMAIYMFVQVGSCFVCNMPACKDAYAWDVAHFRATDFRTLAGFNVQNFCVFATKHKASWTDLYE